MIAKPAVTVIALSILRLGGWYNTWTSKLTVNLCIHCLLPMRPFAPTAGLPLIYPSAIQLRNPLSITHFHPHVMITRELAGFVN